MIGAIRSATIGTFKWGVSLIGPVVVTEWAVNQFEGLRELNKSAPSATSGFIGLCSFALLRSLTGCGWKTALVASSVIPILYEIGRRKGPSSGGGDYVQSIYKFLKGNIQNRRQIPRSSSYDDDLSTSGSTWGNYWSIRQQNVDPRSLVMTYDLDTFINYIIDSRSNPTVRFRELTEDVKEKVWSTIFSYMERYVQYNPSKKLPFVGYAGETLSLIKTDEDPLKLEAKTGDRVQWRINLDTNAISSDSARTQMYIELLIAKHIFFQRDCNSFYSVFCSLIRFLEHNTIQFPPQLSFSMFNNVLAQHDLTFSVQTECNARDRYFNKTATFIKQSAIDQNNNLTLTVRWSDSNGYSAITTQNYEISIQRGPAPERQTYTFTYQDYEWQVTYNQKAYDLLDICNRLEQESEWNLEFNQNDMRNIFEMMQMNDELLHSPHTLVFHQDSTIPYLTDGTPIPYERLKQIATYTNEAKGQSVLRAEGNRVLWGDEVVEAYSEPVQRFDSDWNSPNYEHERDDEIVLTDRPSNQRRRLRSKWDSIPISLDAEDSSGSEGESDDASNVSHSDKSGSIHDGSDIDFW